MRYRRVEEAPFSANGILSPNRTNDEMRDAEGVFSLYKI